MKAVPRRMLVLGGGPVGVEMAQAVRRLGGEVVLVEGAEHVLANEPAPLGEALGEVLRRDGIEVVLGARVAAARRDGEDYVLELEDGRELRGDRLLVATGRRPRVEGIGLETVGIEADARGIHVDFHCRAAERVWAIGDVTGICPLTHVGKYQGRIVAANLLGEPREANYDAVPRVTYTDPQAAAVGAAEARFSATVLVSEVAKTATYTRAYAESNGFLTLLSDGERLTGAYALGPEAGEWLQQATLAIRARVPLDVLAGHDPAVPDLLGDLPRRGQVAGRLARGGGPVRHDHPAQPPRKTRDSHGRDRRRIAGPSLHHDPKEVTMSTEQSTSTTTPARETKPADLKLEVAILSVSDADRAKAFYTSLGWREDADFPISEGFRVLQFTPPGSQASIIFGTGVTPAAPGSGGSLLLTVDDIEAARAELIERGVEVSEVFHGRGFSDAGQGRIPGRAPDGQSYGSFATFSDPDGNEFLLQEVTTPPARARRGAGRRRARRAAARDRPRARPLRGGHPGAQLVGLVRPLLQRAPAWQHGGAGDRGRRQVHEGGPRCGSPMNSPASSRSRSS